MTKEMTKDEARGIYKSARRLGYSDEEARKLLTLTVDEAVDKLFAIWEAGKLAKGKRDTHKKKRYT